MKTLTAEEISAFSIDELEQLITRCDEEYFDEDNPTYTDETYDLLKQELKENNPDSPVLQRIGSGSAGKIKHDKPMLSLEKGYTVDDIKKWAQKIKGKIAGSPKLDGLALSLKYSGGKLKQAITRGNGQAGEDATDTVRLMDSVPKTIPVSRDIEIRGEAYLPFSAFEWICKNVPGKWENPRNVSSGAIKTEKVTGSRTDFEEKTKIVLSKMAFVAYDVVDSKQDSFVETLHRLRQAKFLIPEPLVVGLDEAIARWEEMGADRGKYDMPVDGIVLRADSYDEFEDHGFTGHHPRGAIAFKFTAEVVETVLREVQWSLGRTGVLTPVGLLEPVRFMSTGVTVSRVTLHNPNRMRELNLSLGATIRLVRSGDVIPTVLETIKPGATPIVFPTECPLCKAPVKERNDFLVCCGDLCQGAAVASIKHFCKTVEIDGFGPANIKLLYEAGIVKSFADLYTKFLQQKDLVEKTIGEGVAAHLFKNVEKAKNLPMEKFLAGLGIPGCGRSLSRKFGEIFRAAKPTELLNLPAFIEKGKIEGLGDVVTQNIAARMPALRETLTSLDPVVKLIQEEKKSGTLTGSSFVFTGALTKRSRSDAQKKVTALGGDTPSSVKKGLTYLVVGTEDGGVKSSKQIKAEKLGVKIINEDEFLKLIGE